MSQNVFTILSCMRKHWTPMVNSDTHSLITLRLVLCSALAGVHLTSFCVVLLVGLISSGSISTCTYSFSGLYFVAVLADYFKLSTRARVCIFLGRLCWAYIFYVDANWRGARADSIWSAILNYPFYCRKKLLSQHNPYFRLNYPRQSIWGAAKLHIEYSAIINSTSMLLLESCFLRQLTGTPSIYLSNDISDQRNFYLEQS